MPVEAATTDRKDLLTRAFFGGLTLIVALGLLGVRQATISGLNAAKHWVATPCVIERSEFRQGDEGERYVEIVYRYDVNGVSYTSDRLDMLPGSMGDDGAWEERLHQSLPVGASGTCYVDPQQPDQSVLDPRRGSAGVRNLLLLATPFLVISAILLFSVGWSLSRERLARAVKSPNAPAIPPPPRELSVLQRLALLQPSAQTLVAWAFLVGFVIVFRIMDGPGHLSDLWPASETAVQGRITRVTPTDQRQFGRSEFEYSFRYEYEGRGHEAVSYGMEKEYGVDDTVDVRVNPKNPGQARIVAMRQREVPSWVVFLFAAVIPLLALGITGSYLVRVKSWKLARIGKIAEATQIDSGRDNVANPLTKYEFLVDGQPYQVDARSGLPPAMKSCHVLYDPEAPVRNLGLTLQHSAVLADPAIAWKTAVLSLIPPAACIAAIVVILRI